MDGHGNEPEIEPQRTDFHPPSRTRGAAEIRPPSPIPPQLVAARHRLPRLRHGRVEPTLPGHQKRRLWPRDRYNSYMKVAPELLWKGVTEGLETLVTESPGVALEQLLHNLVLITGAERGYVVRKGKEIVPAAVFPPPDKGEDQVHTASRTALDLVLKSGEPMVIGDAGWDPRLDPAASIHELHVLSLLCLPLVYRGETMGALYLHDTRRKDAFTHLPQPPLSAYTMLLTIALVGSETGEKAIYDVATGFYSQKYFETILEREVAIRKRDGKPLSLMIVSVDRFEEIEREKGAKVAKGVLKELGGILVTLLRATDVVVYPGRAAPPAGGPLFDGSEFEVILANSPRAGAMRVASRLQAVATIKPFEVDGVSVPVSLSVGVATFPEHAGEARDLLRKAVEALRAARSRGAPASPLRHS